MLATYFLVGSFNFWVLVALTAVFTTICVNSDNNGYATLCLFVFVVVSTLCGDFNPIQAVLSNPLYSVGAALTYVVLGVGWSLIKWYLFVLSRKENFVEFRRKFLLGHNLHGPFIPPQLTQEWSKTWNTQWGVEKEKMTQPLVHDHVVRIVALMVYWPFSAAWTLVDDPLRRLFTFILKRMNRVFDSIASRVFANESLQIEMTKPSVEPKDNFHG